MSICTCKVYKILNRVQKNENVMILVDSYPEKEQKAKESSLEIYIQLKKLVIRTQKINKTGNFKSFEIEKELSKITRKSLIRVDSYKKIDKYLKKASQKTFRKE